MGHDYFCMYCSAVVPCDDPECNDGELHSGTCPECLELERDKFYEDDFCYGKQRE